MARLVCLETRTVAAALLALLAAAAATAGLLLAVGVAPPSPVDFVTTAAARSAIPCVAGLGAASLAVDPALELHLCLPRSFRGVLARRLATIVANATLLAVLVGALADGRAAWTDPGPGALVAPAVGVALSGIGAVTAVRLRDPAAAAGAVGGAWLLQVLWGSQLLRSWPTGPLVLVAIGVATLMLAWRIAADPEAALERSR